MKYKFVISLAFLFLLASSGCDIVSGIFKAGVWTGVLLVVGMIALIVYLLSKRKNN